MRLIIAQLLVILTVLSTHASQEIKGTVTWNDGHVHAKNHKCITHNKQSIPAEQTI